MTNTAPLPANDDPKTHFPAGSGYGFEFDGAELLFLKHGHLEFKVTTPDANFDGLTIFDHDNVRVDLGDDVVKFTTTSKSPQDAVDKIVKALHMAGHDHVPIKSNIVWFELPIVSKPLPEIVLPEDPEFVPGIRMTFTGSEETGGVILYVADDATQEQAAGFRKLHERIGNHDTPNELHLRKR